MNSVVRKTCFGMNSFKSRRGGKGGGPLLPSLFLLSLFLVLSPYPPLVERLLLELLLKRHEPIRTVRGRIELDQVLICSRVWQIRGPPDPLTILKFLDVEHRKLLLCSWIICQHFYFTSRRSSLQAKYVMRIIIFG